MGISRKEKYITNRNKKNFDFKAIIPDVLAKVFTIIPDTFSKRNNPLIFSINPHSKPASPKVLAFFY